MDLITAKELQLADVVRVVYNDDPPHAFSTATVKQIKGGTVTLFRPYVKTEDFSYTGGVICYTGIEEFDIPLSTDSKFELYARKDLE
jgi:hypothetical protein